MDKYFLCPFNASTMPGVTSPNLSTLITSAHHARLSEIVSQANVKFSIQYWVDKTIGHNVPYKVKPPNPPPLKIWTQPTP
ncbi:hypothetical protein P5673_021527 [Acropora cervicornis]|uniref:Uncharacterized protein n=1 Tax=Acropora cervicornis TaxID=6130 RepID=A0AAD9V0E6_ACRCE|nr:hypothetical protein P5673_021527 [Acropora cervicornis]